MLHFYDQRKWFASEGYREQTVTMKAILLEGSKAALREIPTPEIGPGEVLLSVDACGLCGSDLLKLDCEGVAAGPRPGRNLGHELTGRVVRKGPQAPADLGLGDRVIVAHHVPCGICHYCRHQHPSMCPQFKETNLEPGGFSEFVRVSERHVRHTLLKIPSGLDSLSASLTEPLACCLRNVRRMNLAPQDSVGVIGLGSIGLLMCQALRQRGLAVLGFDLDPARLRAAHNLGLKASDGRDAVQRIAELTDGRGLDALTFTAGSPTLVADKIRWVRDGGVINLFAELGPSALAALDFKEFYHRELTLMSSYSPAPNDLEDALRLIASGAISVAPLVCNTFTLAQFDEAVRSARSREILKAILVPEKNTAISPPRLLSSPVGGGK